MSENTLKKRTKKAKEPRENDGTKEAQKVEKEEKKELRYGPMPKFKNQRMWSRGIMIVGVLVYMYFFGGSGKETPLALHKDIVHNRGQSFDCSDSYKKDITKFTKCLPQKCGRFVTDKLITANEARTLLKTAMQGFAFGGSSGGATILDIHSGALSLGEKFVNIHTIPESKKLFTPEFLVTYKMVKEKIQHAITELFNIDDGALHLTHPTFFSRLTSDEAKTEHDEYWHPHVDKDTYESFHYTSLLYLSDFGADFKGGRFIFQNEEKKHNVTIEPRLGRVSMFTSGEENTHFVERVTTGTRYAITISFTCDAKHSIQLPNV